MPKKLAIPGYAIERCIGTGSMGSVYAARQLALGRRVALKILHPWLLEKDEGFADRLAREAATTASLRHPNVIAVHQTGEYGGHCYLAMDLIEGGSLKERLAEGPLAPAEILRIATGVASGLAAAHNQGFVHRDIKPANILLDFAGNPLITDFGIVKITYARSERSGVRTVGTPSYMSPEQVQGLAELDRRSDLYSLGVVLFEMLEGHPPFASDDGESVRSKHLQASPPSLGAGSEAFAPVVARLLEKRPQDRFQTAGELLEALREVERRLARQGPAGPGSRGLRRRGGRPGGPAAVPRATGRRPRGAAAPEPVEARTLGLALGFLRGRYLAVVAAAGLAWAALSFALPGFQLATVHLELQGLLGGPERRGEVADRFEALGNTRRARAWLARAAAGGLAGAGYELGLALRGQDEAAAITAFEAELATDDSWNLPASLLLGELLCNGQGVEQCRRAVAILRAVAERYGHPRAMQTLGDIHLDRLPVSRPDRAAEWFERALAGERDEVPRTPETTAAMLGLARLVSEGRGVALDAREATRLYVLAAMSPVAEPGIMARARERCRAPESRSSACERLEEG